MREKEQGELRLVSSSISFLHDKGKEGKEERLCENKKERRAENRKEEIRWGKMVGRKSMHSSLARLSHFRVPCLLPPLCSPIFLPPSLPGEGGRGFRARCLGRKQFCFMSLNSLIFFPD